MFRMMGTAILATVTVFAPAWAATVTPLTGAPSTGTAIALSVDDFQRIGACGGGGSVVNDGCTPIIKTDPLAPHAYGRFDPLNNYWIDSQDIDLLKWTVTAPTAFTSMVFALTDAHDQKNSHFTMSFNQGGTWTPIWTIATQKSNANLYWLEVDFGQAVTMAEFLFSTKVGSGYDGYGISSLTVSEPAPVPVPTAALLLASATGLFGAIRRWRRKG